MNTRKLAVAVAAASAVALGIGIPAAAQAATSDDAQTSRPTIAPPQQSKLSAGLAKTESISNDNQVGLSSACWYDGSWWCNNAPGAALYDTNFVVVGHVETDPSIFSCRSDAGGDHGGPHPTRWVWTQADDTGAWGWMNDNDISSETDTLPVC